MFQLTRYEKDKLKQVLSDNKYDPLLDLEETCDGSKSYHFEVYPSNIGDTVYVVFYGEKTLLSDIDSF